MNNANQLASPEGQMQWPCSAENRVRLEISTLNFELLADCYNRANWPWAGVLESLAIGGARWTPADIPNAVRLMATVQKLQAKCGEWANSGGLTVFPDGTMKLAPCLSAHWRALAPNAAAQAPLPQPGATLVREAMERCIRMDEGAANSYRHDASRCAASPYPQIQLRGPELIARAENLERTAEAYRAILAENGGISKTTLK